jgi:hypothetical protein
MNLDNLQLFFEERSKQQVQYLYYKHESQNNEGSVSWRGQ